MRSYVALGTTRVVAEDDVCSVLYRTQTGDPLVYTDPISDPAPWYDPNRPESADFLGFMLLSIDVGTVPYRNITRYATRYGGANIGPARYTERAFDFTGWLIASSVSGREYGKRWLTTALTLGQIDSCINCSMDYRVGCPPDDGSNDADGAWTAYDVGLTSGPEYTDSTCADVTQVAFTITAGNPYLFKPTLVCADPQPLQTDPDPDGTSPCVPFCDWFHGPPSDAICCAIAPPFSGFLGAVVTIDATDGGVGGFSIATYESSSPEIGVDEPIGIIHVPSLDGILTVDSARHTIEFIDADGNTSDGTRFVDSAQWPIQWADIFPSDSIHSVCVSADAPCSGGYTTQVSIATQTAEL